MTTADQVLRRVRALCLALPETSETASWGHPNFRAGKRIFAAFEWIRGRPSIAFRLEPSDVDLLLRRPHFFVTPYGRGRWVSVWADRALDWRLVGRLLRRSYRLVALGRMIAALDGASHGRPAGQANEPAAPPPPPSRRGPARARWRRTRRTAMDIRRAVPSDCETLFDIWLRSIRATHGFVSEEDIQSFIPLVRGYLGSERELWVLHAEDGTPMGFIGMSGNKVESLFLAPEFHRRGGGRRLIRHARALHGDLTVDVNEQNTGAVRFYEACGFVVEGRSELDDTGRPYPILHMRLKGSDRLDV